MSEKSKKAEALLRLNGIPVIDRTPLDNAVLFSRHGEVGQAAIDLLEMYAELAALRELLEAVRETRHLGNHAKPGHIAAALELCEEQLKAVERIEQ
jgi:F0F1-type ATP synthase delta subunit